MRADIAALNPDRRTQAQLKQAQETGRELLLRYYETVEWSEFGWKGRGPRVVCGSWGPER
jgi:hypothetical protein